MARRFHARQELHAVFPEAERLLQDEFRTLEDPTAVAEHIRTDDITIAQVADRIAASAGLTLRLNTDGRLRGRLRRAWVGARHIRFD